METLSCGELASLSCITKRTLRFYQEKGLVEPLDLVEATGERVYGLEQVTKLDMIAHLKSMGLKLDDIGAIDESKSVDELQRRIAERVTSIKEEMRELEEQRYLAEELLFHCDTFLDHPLCERPLLEVLPERSIIDFEIDNRIMEGPFDTSEQWERAIHAVKRSIAQKGWPLSLFRNVGTFYQRSSQAGGQWRPTVFFVLANEAFGDCYAEARTQPGGPHLVVYYLNSCDDAGGSLDPERLDHLVCAAEEMGLTPGGDPFCEPVFRYLRHFNENYQSFHRFCLPLSR